MSGDPSNRSSLFRAVASGSRSSSSSSTVGQHSLRSLEPLDALTPNKGKGRASTQQQSVSQGLQHSLPQRSRRLAIGPNSAFSRPFSTFGGSPAPSSLTRPTPPFPPHSFSKGPNPFSRNPTPLSPSSATPLPSPLSSKWVSELFSPPSPLHAFLDALVHNPPADPVLLAASQTLARTTRQWARGLDQDPTYFDDRARKLSVSQLRNLLKEKGLGRAAIEDVLTRALKQVRGQGLGEMEKSKMVYFVWRSLAEEGVEEGLVKGEVWDLIARMVPPGFPFLETVAEEGRVGTHYRVLSASTNTRSVPQWLGLSEEDAGLTRTKPSSSRSRLSSVSTHMSGSHSIKKRRRRREPLDSSSDDQALAPFAESMTQFRPSAVKKPRLSAASTPSYSLSRSRPATSSLDFTPKSRKKGNRHLKDEDKSDLDLPPNETSRALQSQRTDALYGLASDVHSSGVRAADAAKKEYSKSSKRNARTSRYRLNQKSTEKPSEESQLNDAEEEEDDDTDDCIIYRPLTFEKSASEEDQDYKPVEEEEDPVELKEDEDEDLGEESLRSPVRLAPAVFSSPPPPPRRLQTVSSQEAELSAQAQPQVPPLKAPAPVLEEDEDDEVMLPDSSQQAQASAAVPLDDQSSPKEEDLSFVLDPPEEEVIQQRPSHRFQRISVSQEVSSPSSHSSLGTEPTLFEGIATLTWLENSPVPVQASVKIATWGEGKHALEVLVIKSRDALSSPSEEVGRAVVDEPRRTITWKRPAFNDELSLVFESLSDTDSCWETYLKLHRTIFAKPSPLALPTSTILEEDEVDEVVLLRNASKGKERVLDLPALVKPELRSLSINFSSSRLDLDRTSDFPLPSRCSIRVSLLQQNPGAVDPLVVSRWVSSTRLSYGPDSLVHFNPPISIHVNSSIFESLDSSLLSFVDQPGLPPSSSLSLRVEYLSFLDPNGRPSQLLLKAFFSSSSGIFLQSLRIPGMTFPVVSTDERGRFNWGAAGEAFAPAGRFDGSESAEDDTLELLSLRWVVEGGGDEDKDEEMAVIEEVEKREEVSESPAQRAVKKALALDDDDDEDDEVVEISREEAMSRKRKGGDADAEDDNFARQSFQSRLSQEPLNSSQSDSNPPSPPPAVIAPQPPSPTSKWAELSSSLIALKSSQARAPSDLDFEEIAPLEVDMEVKDVPKQPLPAIPVPVVQPPSSLASAPSQEDETSMDDEEHFPKARILLDAAIALVARNGVDQQLSVGRQHDEVGSRSSKEDSSSARASSLLTDEPVDERMEKLAKKHRSHRSTSSRLPLSSASAELSAVLEVLQAKSPIATSSHDPEDEDDAAREAVLCRQVWRATDDDSFDHDCPPTSSRKTRIAKLQTIKNGKPLTGAEKETARKLAEEAAFGRQVFGSDTDDPSSNDDFPPIPTRTNAVAGPSRLRTAVLAEANEKWGLTAALGRPKLPSEVIDVSDGEEEEEKEPRPQMTRTALTKPRRTSVEDEDPGPQEVEDAVLPARLARPNPKAKLALKVATPSSSRPATRNLLAPTPSIISTSSRLKTKKTSLASPCLLRADSASSSSSSNVVASKFPSIDEAQKIYTLYFNPQEATGRTFPLVVNKVKKPPSQRVLGGTFGDRLWRLEDATKDYSWRMRERDEAIWDIEGLHDGLKIMMCLWNRHVEEKSPHRICTKTSLDYTVDFVKHFFKLMDDLRLHPFLVVHLTTLRSFELIDNKVFAAALAKWGVLKRERVAKKSAEASVAKRKQPVVAQ